MFGFRPFSSSEHTGYRFGFNGMEKDDEVKGNGNSYTTLFRQYDPRTGRWFSVDPKARLMAWQSPYTSMDNNPISKTDPKGDCPICPMLIGAGVGGLVDAGLQALEISLSDDKTFKDDFSGTSVLISATAGATGAGLATKVKRFGTVVNLVADATFSAANQAATLKDGQEFSGTKVVTDVVAGQLGGKVVGDLVEKSVKKSPAIKMLNEKLDRANRVAGDYPRTSRKEAVDQASGKIESYMANRVTAASTAASGAVTKVKDVALDVNGGSNLQSQPLAEP